MTDLTRKRGDTYADEIVLKRKSTSTPIDITGWSFKLTVDSSQKPTDTSTKKYSVTGVILDAVNGKVEFPPLITDVDLVGTYYYDIQATDSMGRIRTIMSGKYTFEQDITKT